HDLYRVSDTPPFNASSIAPLTSGDAGGLLTGKVVLDIEVDSTNRVFFTKDVTGWSNYPPLIKYFGPPNQGAGPNIYWFDYAGSPVGTVNTISTGGVNVVAICLGSNNDLYVMDYNHIFHHYLRSTNYTEDVTAPFPMNLGPIIGNATGSTGSSTYRMVGDVVQNWHNGAFYVLTVSGVSSNNGRLYRIPCDGSATSVSATWTIIDIGSGSRNIDLAIDQIDSSGNPKPEGDVQLIVGGQSLFTAGQPDLWLFNCDLQMTASADFGFNDTTASKGRLVATRDNRLVTSNDYSRELEIFQTPPTGWQ
ncbi:MAG: hypothetical protein ABI743_10015, partial [bacterium]